MSTLLDEKISLHVSQSEDCITDLGIVVGKINNAIEEADAEDPEEVEMIKAGKMVVNTQIQILRNQKLILELLQQQGKEIHLIFTNRI